MFKSVLDYLCEHAELRGDLPAYGEHVDGAWRTTPWKTYHRQTRDCARALMSLGLEPGQRVGILGGNRPQWAVSCLGTMSAGGVSVGIYQTSSPDQVAYILDHAETPVVVVEDRAQLAKIEQVRDRLPHLRHVVLMTETVVDTDDVLGWQELLRKADDVADADLDQRLGALEADDTATFIYTSGTTAEPKAVMLSHGNLVDTGRIGNEIHGFDHGDSLVSYLPLAHVAEQMMSVHMPAFVAYTVYYAQAPEQLPKYMLELEPSIFFAVPRVWEKIHAKVTERLQESSGATRLLVRWAVAAGRRYSDALNRGRRPGPWTHLRWTLADALVARKLRRRMGLGKLRLAASGAAPIRREILDFFSGLGVRIYEVYGLSETCGPGTWNRAGEARLGTVGPALPGVEVKLGDDGEVMFRGPNVFQGYFKDETTTRRCLGDDGWFSTGDLGQMDDEGYLTITGRKKELIITSGGKNIAPAGIESRLKDIVVVGDAMVIGDDRRFLTALLTVEEEGLSSIAGRDPARPAHEDPAVVAAIRQGILDVNRRVSRVETVRNFRVLEHPFSPETGELTPTLKLKRRVIEKRYRDDIESMYAEGQVLKPESA